MDGLVWQMRGAAFLRSIQAAIEELRANTQALKGEQPLGRDVVDPTSDSLKKCFTPLYDSLWDECRPGCDPAVREMVFGDKPTPEEVKNHRVWKARFKKIEEHVRAIEEYCRAGQVRFPVAAAKYEFLRLEVIRKCESPFEWATVRYHEQLDGIRNALREISILTIGDVLQAVAPRDSERMKTNDPECLTRRRSKCTSRFAGRTIRNLSIASDGVTFTVSRQYTYQITAKKAIEFLDKLIDSYEKTNEPIRAEFQVASVFKRKDAMRFRKRFMICKNHYVRLNIQD